MKDAGKALTTVVSEDLKKLLTAIFRGHLEGPLEVTGLTRVGLQHCALELTGHMRGLELKAVQAVLVAVLAERRAAEEREQRAHLVPHGGEA